MRFIDFHDMSWTMQEHYASVRTLLLKKKESGILKGKISDEYIEKMAHGLNQWVEHAKKQNICWGYMVFQKIKD